MGVSKNRGKTPKMDGLFHGKPYEQMDDLRGKNTIFGNIHIHPWSLTWNLKIIPWKRKCLLETIMASGSMLNLGRVCSFMKYLIDKYKIV